LLPYRVESLEQQTSRALIQLRSQETPLLRNLYLEALRSRNETLFFRLMANHFEELAPLVYTPVVGQACVQFSLQLREHAGLFVTMYDRGSIAHVLDSWRRPNVDIIVVTDGSRILGLGDLGAGGMGIPIGKLILYTAAAGFHPSATLPITLDVGCNSDAVLADPHYVGVPEKRTLSEADYYALVDEFMDAVYRKWPQVLVQFEDFSNDHCFDLLARYRDKYLMFNDDIQGTGAVVAAGIVNAWRATGTEPARSRFVFLGAGAAGVGVAQQIVDILVLKHGIDRAAAYKQFWFVDSRGVVANARGDKLEAHKCLFARDDLTAEQVAGLKTLEQVVEFVKPDVLIGLSGMPKAFTAPILRRMGELNQRPVVFALSNPTDKAECSASEAYEATGGRAIFAAGSPFDPVTLADGTVRTPGQANNMYVFPSIGFAASLCAAKRVTDAMVAASVIALAAAVSDEQIRAGLIYPKLCDIRAVAAVVTKAVIERCVADGEARRPPPADRDLATFIQENTYNPEYVVDAKL
jgi:malate dehydrogenase (oxaloacetate-decarboxylating)(NADP+)